MAAIVAGFVTLTGPLSSWPEPVEYLIALLIPFLAFSLTYAILRLYIRATRSRFVPYAIVRRVHLCAIMIVAIDQSVEWLTRFDRKHRVAIVGQRWLLRHWGPPRAGHPQQDATPLSRIEFGRTVRLRTRNRLDSDAVELLRQLAYLNGHKSVKNCAMAEGIGKKLTWISHDLEDPARRQYALEVLAAIVRQCVSAEPYRPPEVPQIPFGKAPEFDVSRSSRSRLRDIPGHPLLIGSVGLIGAIIGVASKLLQ
ncbi:hypothetical protein ACWEGE_28600 [Amycolatopsis sp. NPDC004747]